ncbi:hypothetical protein [Micromonospora sp. NPDC005171]|uniref:hypothetical protein n=1 Tax=Micromonospora sp. NPDC005171 TaxID=3156866 RepID=UPI0033A6B0A0
MVLHRFDADGVRTASDIQFAGTSEDEEASGRRPEARLVEWLVDPQWTAAGTPDAKSALSEMHPDYGW